MRLYTSIIMMSMMMFHSCTGDESKQEEVTDSIKVDSITLVFAGDMMSHMPQVKAAYNPQSKRHEYEHWFQFLKDTIASADYAIANLENSVQHDRQQLLSMTGKSVPLGLLLVFVLLVVFSLVISTRPACSGSNTLLLSKTLDIIANIADAAVDTVAN